MKTKQTLTLWSLWHTFKAYPALMIKHKWLMITSIVTGIVKYGLWSKTIRSTVKQVRCVCVHDDTSVFVCVGGGHAAAAQTLLFSAFCSSYITTLCPSYFERVRKHIGPEHKVLEYYRFNFGHLHAWTVKVCTSKKVLARCKIKGYHQIIEKRSAHC